MPDSIVWFDAQGNSTTLFVQYGATGRFAPPAIIHDDEVPGISGSRFREVRHGPREFVLPIMLFAANESAMRTQIRALVATMDPIRGMGRIRIISTLGTTREIQCRVTAGLELDESDANTFTQWQRAVVAFKAFDPYFYDITSTTVTYSLGTPATFFPFFPLRLSSSEVFSDATVINTGDVEMWPQWSVTGPGGSPIVFRNLTSGEVLTINYPLAAGETMAVDTRPGFKLITKGDGTNLWPYIDQTSSMWSFGVGTTNFRVEMGAATVASQVRLTYTLRNLTP